MAKEAKDKALKAKMGNKDKEYKSALRKADKEMPRHVHTPSGKSQAYYRNAKN